MLKRILITGACGFIGSHLCDDLIARGYEVVGLDNLDPQVHGDSGDPPAYLNASVEFINGSVADNASVGRALKGVDAVIHLAAKVGVGQSAYQMGEYVFNNTFGTAVLLDKLKDQHVEKLIVASSMSVYGEGDVMFDAATTHYLPVATDENKEPELESVYALTKYDQERLCLLFGKAYNVPTIALRFFNVYGTRQSLSNPYTGVMAIFASRLLNGKPPIIYEDGEQSRDFVHVSDVINGIRLALESDVRDEVINIGSGNRYNIRGLAERLATALGSNLQAEITGQNRVGDIRHCFADISKARELLGYAPKMSIEDGIAELVAWLKTQAPDDKLEAHKAELEARGLLQ